MSRRSRLSRSASEPAPEEEAESMQGSSESAPAAAAADTPAAKPVRSKTTASAKPHPSAVRFANTHHWLMKNEPPFSLAALKERPNQTEPWVGVRSREAKCMMQYGMKLGDAVLYYNASISNPHIAGVARVCSAPYADPTAFDPASPYFDAKSDPAAPTWLLVDVRFEREFARPVYLAELRRLVERGEMDKDFTLFRRRRLSIHPLTQTEYDRLCALAETPLPEEIKLKAERAVRAHPSRAKESAAAGKEKKKGAHGWKKRKRGDAEDEEDGEEGEEGEGSEDGSESGDEDADEGESAGTAAPATASSPPANSAAAQSARKKARVAPASVAAATASAPPPAPFRKRVSFVMSVNAGQVEEYTRRHQPIWPELHAVLKAHGTHNYSIFHLPSTNQLFAYAEIESEERWDSIAQTEVCQRWWAHMGDVMPSNPDHSPVSQPLHEVFHID